MNLTQLTPYYIIKLDYILSLKKLVIRSRTVYKLNNKSNK